MIDLLILPDIDCPDTDHQHCPQCDNVWTELTAVNGTYFRLECTYCGLGMVWLTETFDQHADKYSAILGSLQLTDHKLLM
jgi:transcription elongation factor Elf1